MDKLKVEIPYSSFEILSGARKGAKTLLYEHDGSAIAILGFVPPEFLAIKVDDFIAFTASHDKRFKAGRLATQVFDAFKMLLENGMYSEEGISAANFLTKYVPDAYPCLDNLFNAGETQYQEIVGFINDCCDEKIFNVLCNLSSPAEPVAGCRGEFDKYRK